MRASHFILTALAVLVAIPFLSGTAAAQDEESAFVYASYFQCTGGVSDAAATLRDDWGPITEKHMDAGDVAAWGVLTHDTGNEWSLAMYHIGPDVNGLRRAIAETEGEYFEAHEEAGTRFMEACPTHEDYVWSTGPGSEPGAAIARQRPVSGMSVYYICDEGREALADHLVEEVMGPLYDRQVAEGRLNSWGWLSHYLGGKYRRLLVTDAASQADLLEARERIIEDDSTNPALSAAFSDVCNGHTDILWNIVASRP